MQSIVRFLLTEFIIVLTSVPFLLCRVYSPHLNVASLQCCIKMSPDRRNDGTPGLLGRCKCQQVQKNACVVGHCSCSYMTSSHCLLMTLRHGLYLRPTKKTVTVRAACVEGG